MDYNIQRCTRHCSASGRPLAEGEEYYSALFAEGAELRRQDFSAEAWQGPPEGAVGWWKSRIPTRDARGPKLAPNEVLLQIFLDLEQDPGRAELRYVLALLLARRRVLRACEGDELGDWQTFLCPRDESTHRVRVAVPDNARVAAIQAELERVLAG